MRQLLRRAILAAAVTGVFASFAAPQAFSQAAPPVVDAKADNQAAIPVKQVVLFSSGVGYFEHFGTVKGNGATQLQFKTQQINDILKSLVLQDLDKGKVGVITYPSQDPIAKTLRSFQVDITSNPGLADLLGQLRGAKVSVTNGAEKVSGTVLGVEKKPRAVGTGKDAQVIDVYFVNLITAAGIRSLSLDDVKSLEIEDKKLQDELTRALAALASARDQDKKPVTINFTGDGDRRIRIGYVVETPVWKTSYRLVLADAPKDEKKQAEGALQGWAIVENQTDNDWSDVQLSLVSGRPISFIQDLYQPLYIPRPVVQPELYASLRPQTYDGGIDKAKELRDFGGVAGAKGDSDGTANRRASLARKAPEAAEAGSFANSPQNNFYEARKAGGESLAAMDVTASVASVASAAKVGELFQYTVGNVTLPRQTSAMIPVVTDAVEIEKLSIYNQSVLPKNPLLGARLKNTTGKHLLQGPVTVLDGGAYAGDARVDDLPPGQERLVSYGVDQQILVQAQNNQQRSSLTSGKLVKGVLHLVFKDIATQDYVAENKGDKDKTLVIEHAKFGGAWKLTEPAKADESTDSLYRFKGKVAAGKGTKLTVKQELVRGEEIAILPMDINAVLNYSKSGSIPENVRELLTKAAGFKQALLETERQMRDRTQKISVISQEQTRLRENMKTVAQNTEYYTRLLKKLDEQETQIEGLQKEIVGLQKTAETQRKALEDYVNGMTVG